MRVLVALNATPSCAKIEAVGRLWPTGSTFLLPHVLDPFRFVRGPISPRREKEAARAKFKCLSQCLVETGWKIETEMILGHPRRWDAQMIVLGSHGRRGFGSLTMGSVSEHVAFHSHCSVKVIRSPKAPKERSRKGESQ